MGAGEAAAFSTTIPHGFGGRGAPAEILAILDHADEDSRPRPGPEAEPEPGT
ncbi:hypothetical protein [Streptomyces sp. NPDC058373]|uniref:hypothetical protein n=1 Tax=unclassified Streptomyces TaxID=2593676 RepID=UPI00364B002A